MARLARRALGACFLLAVCWTGYACTAPTPVVDDPDQSSAPTSAPARAPAKQLDNADASVPDAEPTCSVPAGQKCAADPQCGCAMTETCDITNAATGATSCVTGGSATLGRPCTQTGDCVPGLTCRYGACRPYCSTPRSKCGVAGTELCVETLDDKDKPLPGNDVCTIKCDPRNPSAVCGSNACLWFSSYYKPEKVSDCNYAGTTLERGKCTTDSDCSPGLACFQHPKYGMECEKWCRLGVAGDCGSGQTCKDVLGADAPVVDGVSEGVCQDNK